MRKFLVASLLALLSFVLPSVCRGQTGSFIQRTQNDSCSSGSSTCTKTITSTTAGNLLVCFANNLSVSSHITSCTDGGDTFVVCATSCNGSDSGAGANDMQYILSTAGGKTTLTCNVSAAPSSTWTCGVFEFHTTTSGWTYDTSGNIDDTSSGTTLAGKALTLTGSCEVVVRIAGSSTSLTNINLGYVKNIDTHTNMESYLLSTTNGAAPNYTLGSNGTLAEGAAAFKEGAGCSNTSSSTPALNKRSKLEKVDSLT